MIEFRCSSCHRKLQWEKKRLIEGLSDGRRLVQAEKAAHRDLTAQMKSSQQARLAAAQGNADELNRQLERTTAELRTALGSALAATGLTGTGAVRPEGVGVVAAS
jgi:hypothetical protein